MPEHVGPSVERPTGPGPGTAGRSSAAEPTREQYAARRSARPRASARLRWSSRERPAGPHLLTMLDGGWTSCGCGSSSASHRAHPAERLRQPLRTHRCRARRSASFRRPGLRPAPCAGCAWRPAPLRRAQCRSRSSRVLIRVCRYSSRSCSHASAPATPLRCREAVVRQQRPRRRDGSRLVVEPPRRGVACASPTDPCKRVQRRRQAGRGALLLLVRRVVAQRCGTSCN